MPLYEADASSTQSELEKAAIEKGMYKDTFSFANHLCTLSQEDFAKRVYEPVRANMTDSEIDLGYEADISRVAYKGGLCFGMTAISVLGPGLHALPEAVRSGHDGCASGEQAVDDLCGDGVRGNAGHDGDIACEAACFGGIVRLLERLVGHALERGGKLGVSGLARIPCGFIGDGLAQADEAAVQCGGVVVVVGAGLRRKEKAVYKSPLR